MNNQRKGYTYPKSITLSAILVLTASLPVLAQPQTSSDQDPKVLLRPPILPADTRPKSDDEAKFEKSIKGTSIPSLKLNPEEQLQDAGTIYKDYLSSSTPAARLDLVEFLDRNLPTNGGKSVLEHSIANEYIIVDGFLSGYKSVFPSTELKKQDVADALKKQSILLGALAYSLAQLNSQSSQVNYPGLYLQNYNCVRDMAREVAQSKKPLSEGSVSSRLEKFAKRALK